MIELRERMAVLCDNFVTRLVGPRMAELKARTAGSTRPLSRLGLCGARS